MSFDKIDRSRYPDKDEVYQAARGRWLEIFQFLGHGRLDPAIQHLGRHVPCPVHGGKDGFRLFSQANDSGQAVCNTCSWEGRSPDEGFPGGLAVLRWLHGWDFPTALREVAAFLGMTSSASPAIRTTPLITPPKIAPRMSDADIQRMILDTWRESLPLDHPDAQVARTYLTEHRKLVVPVPTLKEVRYHPQLYYASKDGAIKRRQPALILRQVDVNNRPVTLHRIYLEPDGRKADYEDAKKSMFVPSDRTTNGSAVRLDPVQPWLSVAEGLESALSVREILGLPTWACTVAGCLTRLELPERIRVVLIWADRDDRGTGQAAADTLAARLRQEGRQVEVLLPPAKTIGNEKGADWNDALKQWGAAAFRQSAWFTETRAKVQRMHEVAQGRAAA